MAATTTGRLRRSLAILGGTLLLGGGCADEPTTPRDGEGAEHSLPVLESLLNCTVDVQAGDMTCTTVESYGSARPNLIVGGQDRFVRLNSDDVVIEDDLFLAQVTVQNLTFQPFGTNDGNTQSPRGVRVFFVDAPNNGVVVTNADGTAPFLGSAPKNYFQFGSELFGDDGILAPGETSAPKQWEFALNGATTFTFSVLLSTVVPVPAGTTIQVARVAAPASDDGRHTCGELVDGRLFCWGRNSHGQLGAGTSGDTIRFPVEVKAPAGVTLSNVALGEDFTCAEGSDDKIYCWGSNQYGQLGDSTNNASPLPVAVKPPVGVTLSGLTVGEYHACAEGSDGNAYCWGNGLRGRLGYGSTSHRNAPIAVQSPTGVTLSGLAAGAGHTCASGSDGNSYCWGWNSLGQLGDGGEATQLTTPSPVSTPDGLTLSNLSAGYNHTCGDGSDGKIYCWGYNDRLQSGAPGDSNSILVPTAIPDAPGGVTLSRPVAGWVHTCADGSDDKVYCWGRNTFSELGTTALADSVTATPVAAQHYGAKLKGPAVGRSHTCAIDDGEVYCWGLNTAGELGLGTRSILRAYTPGPVPGTSKQ